MGHINFDRTFCCSDKCALRKRCDRHGERINEWAADEKKVVTRPISMGDFYEEKKVCEMFGEVERPREVGL